MDYNSELRRAISVPRDACQAKAHWSRRTRTRNRNIRQRCTSSYAHVINTVYVNSEKAGVGGSTPSLATTFKHLAAQTRSFRVGTQSTLAKASRRIGWLQLIGKNLALTASFSSLQSAISALLFCMAENRTKHCPGGGHAWAGWAIRLIVSLPNQNRYQQEQVRWPKRKPTSRVLKYKTLDANNEPGNQSQPLLEVLQSRTVPRPDAILVEPLTSSELVKVAEAAVDAGIGWVVLKSPNHYQRHIVTFSLGAHSRYSPSQGVSMWLHQNPHPIPGI